jgi:hypothetical protein
MRRAVASLVFALLATAMLCAQTQPAGSNNPPATPQTQSPNSAAKTPGAAQGEDRQVGGTQPQNPNSTSSQTGTPNSPANASGQNGTGASGFDQIAAGTEIRAVLDTPLSTKTSKPGDRFTATITEPARGSGGSVVAPTGARIEGEVGDADENKTLATFDKGKLSLRFRDLVLPNGQTLPLAATLISVNDTNGKSARKPDEEGRAEFGTRGRDIAKDTGPGPGIGGTGMVFGAPLKGLAIGNLSGGGYVLATKKKDVNLPAQTGMVIRLDQPLSGNGATQ